MEKLSDKNDGNIVKRRQDIMDSLFIVMPAYNEESNIEFVVRQWYKILKEKVSAHGL